MKKRRIPALLTALLLSIQSMPFNVLADTAIPAEEEFLKSLITEETDAEETDDTAQSDDAETEEDALRSADDIEAERVRELFDAEVKEAFLSELRNEAAAETAAFNPGTETNADGDYGYEVLEDGTVQLNKYYGAGGDVVIPETYNGYPVSGFSIYAFSYNDTITSVQIPAAITELPESAFRGCGSLTKVVFEGDIVSIGNFAFNSCGLLTDIVLPDTVKFIGDRAFSCCESLPALELPDTLESIGAFAFTYCESLTELHIPASVARIGEGAFSSSGIQKITVDSGNKAYCTDSYGALYDIGKTVLMFYPLNSTNTSYHMPDTVTTVEEDVFYNSGENLTEITLSDKLVTIGDHAFAWVKNVTEFDLPSTLTTIGTCAFLGCTSVKEWNIPAGVTSIGDSAFSYCKGAERFTVASENPNYASDSEGVLCNKEKTRLIRYPLGRTDSAYTVPEGVEVIGKRSFEYSDVLFVEFPGTLTTVESGAFSSSALLHVEIPEGCTVIGDEAFANCMNLASIILPGGIESIGEKAFGVSSWEDPSVSWLYFKGTLPGSIGVEFLPVTYEVNSNTTENVTIFYDPALIEWTGETWMHSDGLEYAISPVTELTDADFEYTVNEDGTSVTITAYIGESLYVEIPDTIGGYTVTGIEGLYYYRDSWDTSNLARCISIPDTVTTFGTVYSETYTSPMSLSTFQHLTTVVLPDNMTSLSGISLGSSSILYIDLPDGITEIPAEAFNNCSRLGYIDLPAELVSIGKDAFSDTEIISLTLPESVESIADGAFNGMNLLKTLSVDENNAAYSSEDGILYNKNKTEIIRYPSRKYTEYVSGEGYTAYDFPSSVKKIAPYAFEDCTIYYNFAVPEGVTEIGDFAFYNNYYVKTYTIPASVTTIGTGAFAANDNIEAFIVDEDSDSFMADAYGALFDKDMTRLYRYAFGRGDTSYEIPASVETVSAYAFEYGISYPEGKLNEIIMNEGLTKVESYAFSSQLMVQVLRFPDSLTALEPYAVSCANIVSVYFGTGKMTLPDYALYNNSKLTGVYFEGLPPDVESNTFPYDTSKFKLYFIENTEGWTTPTWKESEYDYREYNTATFIPVETIGNTSYVVMDKYGVAFGSAYPGSVSAGLDACTSGTLITGDPICRLSSDGTKYSWSNDRDTAEFIFDGDASTIFDPFASDDTSWCGLYADQTYRLTEIRIKPREYKLERLQGMALQGSNDGTKWDCIWFSPCPAQNFDYIVIEEDDMLNTGSYRYFRYVSLAGQHGDIAELELYGVAEKASEPETPKMPEYTYTVNADGTSITLNKYMGQAVDFEIPETIDGYTLTVIGSSAFAYCNTLETVVIPDTVTTLDHYAFRECRSLREITIPDSVTAINDYVFWYCSALETVRIPANVETIGTCAFSFCTSLDAFEVDEASTHFTTDAYGTLYDSGMTRLIQFPIDNDNADELFVVPEGVEVIERYSFGDAMIRGFTLPDGLKTIRHGAFYGCYPETITIPASLTVLEAAFQNNNNLNSAYFLGDCPETFADDVFYQYNSDFAIYYIAGKSGWTSPTFKGYNCWTVTDDGEYRLSWDTSTLEMLTGETYAFTGRLEAMDGSGIPLHTVSAVIRSADNTAVGIDWFYREYSSSTAVQDFDFSLIPSLTAGDVLSGIPISTSQEKLSFSDGMYIVTVNFTFHHGVDSEFSLTKMIRITDGSIAPVVEIQPASEIAGDSARLSANVTDAKGGIIADWGFLLYDSETAAEPFAVFSKADGMTYSFTDNSFADTVTGLNAGTTVYAEAYASYYEGEIEVRGVSERISFTTQKVIFTLTSPASPYIEAGILR
ncbi:MAG: leucine-rich repeat protein, partial [Clostridia bacterium]|nr:leucine-rich repeat protein [Clostridia bacterium]